MEHITLLGKILTWIIALAFSKWSSHTVHQTASQGIKLHNQQAERPQ